MSKNITSYSNCAENKNMFITISQFSVYFSAKLCRALGVDRSYRYLEFYSPFCPPENASWCALRLSQEEADGSLKLYEPNFSSSGKRIFSSELSNWLARFMSFQWNESTLRIPITGIKGNTMYFFSDSNISEIPDIEKMSPIELVPQNDEKVNVKSGTTELTGTQLEYDVDITIHASHKKDGSIQITSAFADLDGGDNFKFKSCFDAGETGEKIVRMAIEELAKRLL